MANLLQYATGLVSVKAIVPSEWFILEIFINWRHSFFIIRKQKENYHVVLCFYHKTVEVFLQLGLQGLNYQRVRMIQIFLAL